MAQTNVFADILVKELGLSKEFVIDSALKAKQSSKTICEYLLDSLDKENFVVGLTKDILLKVLAKSTSSLYLKELQGYTYDEEIGKLLKSKQMKEYRMIPVKQGKQTLVCFRETSIEVSERVLYVRNLLVRHDCKLAIIPSEVYDHFEAIFIDPVLIKEVASNIVSGTGGNSEIDLNSSNSDISFTLYNTIKAAKALRASDIHFLPMTDNLVRVYFRIDGVKTLYEEYTVPIDTLSRKIKVDANIANNNLNEISTGKLNAVAEGKTLELRVNIIPSKMGDDINLRLLSDKLTTIDSLGMSDKMLSAYNRLLKLTKGIVLLVGPTGSGKSTTMYAGVNIIRDRDLNVCAIEDPVEVKLPGITQVDVTKYIDFSTGVHAFLRHDVDVLIVGETRDAKTAKALFDAGATGHLVLSSLHTNSSLSAIYRLINMGVSIDQITECLAAVIAQRLVRRVCPQCAESYELPANHEWRKLFDLGDGKIILKRGKGCNHCNNTGYYGRIVIQEYIEFTKNIRLAISENMNPLKLEDIVRKQFPPMLDDAKVKALAGLTTFDEIMPLIRDIV